MSGVGQLNQSEANAQISQPADIEALEQERVALKKFIRSSRLKSVGISLVAGIAGTVLMGDPFLGFATAVVAYFLAMEFMTKSKRLGFKANFKKQVVGIIVKSFGLNFKQDGGVHMDNFLMIYDCKVNRYLCEDLIYGQVDGVNIELSDVQAYEVKRITDEKSTQTMRFRGILFVADFNKKLAATTQVCFRSSYDLVKYGERAQMDNVEFEKYFDVYSTDQIGARYVLTPSMMEKIHALFLKLDRAINIVFDGSKIYIAIETFKDNFEASINKSLKDNATIELYKKEIENLIDIVRELNLNEKIWVSES